MIKVGTKRIHRDGRELESMAFVISVRPGEDLEAEFGRVVEALYEWHKEQGERCAALTVGFEASEQDQEKLMAYLVSLIQQERPLRPLFAQLGQVMVGLVSPDGKHIKEMPVKIEFSI